LHLEPLMDIHKIMAVLPHRPPFFWLIESLKCQKVMSLEWKKYEWEFLCHFPEAPVMPGVY
jgi:UDP-3-O-[3-hydroxymyristoyl] N-acetylglucosamine deacetylase/3-hydroxyacyl-[acyl-carrier-protein] dehydratase